MSEAQQQSPHDALVVRARAFDQFVSRLTPVYEFALWLLPFLGRRLCKAIPHIQGPRVLEVSFGTGYLFARYAARFDAVGIDYNPRMIQAAQRRLDRAGVRARLVQGDAHAMPFRDDTFDTLVNTDAFTLYADPVQAMAEFHRVLRPGGRLVLMEYNHPKRRNWLGTQAMALSRVLKMPLLDFDALLHDAGFDYEDHPVALGGALHMYIAHKRGSATASGTRAEPARS